MRIRKEQQLPAFEKLGDKAGIASTLWAIAQIEIARKNPKAAAPKIAEAYSLVLEMGRLEGVAVIGEAFGQNLIAAGRHDEGLAVLQRSLDGFKQLGRDEDAGEMEELLTQARKYIADHPKED